MYEEPERKAPLGKFRVLTLDLWEHEDRLVKDCDTKEEAFEIARRYNIDRDRDSPVYKIWDDQGECLLGNEAFAMRLSRGQS